MLGQRGLSVPGSAVEQVAVISLSSVVRDSVNFRIDQFMTAKLYFVLVLL